MGEIVEFPRKKESAFSVNAGDFVCVMMVSDVEQIALGKSSIAEYKDPEKLAQTLALIIMDYMNVADR